MSVEDIKRSHDIAECRRLNDDALARVMMSHGIVLPRHGQGWRATLRTHGNIRGLDHVGQLEILCTDGIVAYFAICGTDVSSTELFYGHVKDFTGEVKPAFSLPKKPSGGSEADSKKTSSPRAKTAAKTPTVSMALAMLQKLTQNSEK